MGISIQEVYKNKAAISKIDNVNGLIGILQSKDTEAKISVQDRNIVIQSNKDINYSKSIDNWLKQTGIKLTCAAHHLFDSFAISNNSTLIRI